VLKTDVNRNRKKLTVLVAGLTLCAAAVRADGPGHSFTSITTGYSQELFGVTVTPVAEGALGGVALSPDGDVWAAECGFSNLLHRFDRDTTSPDGHGGMIHPESTVDLSQFAPIPNGCGLVNIPGQQYMGHTAFFVNTSTGLWPFDATTGQPILFGPLNSAWDDAGNGRGIAVDPVPDGPLNHIVYTGDDCDPAYAQATCTIRDYNLLNASTRAFARFARSANESIESLYFSPDGSSLFASYRDWDTATHGLLVIARRAVLLGIGETDDMQIVRRIPMSAMPQGMAFHASGNFAVTLNEDGTMTQLSFPGASFTGVPTQAGFASGGFKGGLLQVGPDGCIYAPQGRMDGGSSGVRFGDDAESDSDSIVRICGGFTPAPGVAGFTWSSAPGSISGSAFVDWNRNAQMDAGEPGLSGVAVSLSGPAADSATTDATGAFTLSNVAQGLYSVSAPAAVGALSGNPTPLAVQVDPGQTVTGIDFPYTESVQPVCTSAVETGAPTRVRFTMRDHGSGVRRIRVRSLANFQVSVNGAAPINAPATIDLPSPSMNAVDVTATRSDASQSASVALDVEDAFGTSASCASNVAATPSEPPPPKPTTPPEPPPAGGETIKKELSGRGRVDVEVAARLSKTMRYVTVHNGRRGLEGVDVWVNHHRLRLRNLRNGQVRSLDVGRWMHRGKKNRIVLVGWGQHRDSAVVTISSVK
jgi:hypothetical protein